MRMIHGQPWDDYGAQQAPETHRLCRYASSNDKDLPVRLEDQQLWGDGNGFLLQVYVK